MLTRDQAQATAAAAAAERDTIQANLLELDGSFGKRLLAGATLTGQSRDQWDAASSGLASLWDTFTAYSAVIDRASEILATPGRLPVARLEEVTTLLTGPAVVLTRAVAPLGQRELTAGGQVRQSLQTTVREMRGSFSSVAAVLTAAETVWNQISDGLRLASTQLEAARQELPGLGEAGTSEALAQAQTSLRELRDQLNSDPLALWTGGRVDTSALDRLTRLTAAATAQLAELGRVRREADQRLAEVTAAVGAAQQARQDATVARERAATRILISEAEALPEVTVLAGRLDELAAIKAAGRWTRLASELDLVGKQAAAVAEQCRAAERAASGLIEQRNELRGLLDAYRAKAGGTGGAENADLDQRYLSAKELLWTAPCDLAAAAAAVSGYQHAVLQLRRSGDRT